MRGEMCSKGLLLKEKPVLTMLISTGVEDKVTVRITHRGGTHLNCGLHRPG